MAQEWYLLTSPYTQLGGFEGEAFNDYAGDSFSEMLLELGIDVELCNADLSECTPIRVVLENRTQDTKLNDFRRLILATIGTLTSGMYIKYQNRFWLIESIVDNNGVFEKAVLVFCNWKLVWLNASNKVVERWAYVQSASQYNNGQRENRFFVIQTDQLLVAMPDDEESMSLDQGKRFIMDKRTLIYQKNIPDDVDVDTSNRVDTYKMTRSDSILYNYVGSGHHEIMISQDEQHVGDGFYRIDGVGYWLCNDNDSDLISKEDSEPTDIIRCDILAESEDILIGNGAYSFTALYYDEDGNIVDGGTPEWEIKCNFLDKLQVDEKNNTIEIAVYDSSLFNSSFELLLKYSSEIECSKKIKIKAAI